ncbi:hypothetical protein GPECTOR_6g807 [Gonium pectorale]|uniref:Plastocyanin-like domain-containing protein n=1 Tax=Gonium pectorale TaxID=33097 RepID=A0A150GVM0_GONPE|nr:hypothetical protein GPECTOR_6g807 [Gonium pectorale]|eukprot:KXZ53889.1 hypothetical protein GPECTOR_6g807 [Gonium pectorale]
MVGASTAPSPLLAFNRSTPGPGPLLRLERGREYRLQLTNRDVATGAAAAAGGGRVTLYLHGQHFPNASWADGTDGLTQAAVPPGATFTHRFIAEPAGTTWYHSHVAGQLGDGLRGPVVVTDPRDGRPGGSYDGLYDEDLDEHVMFLTDVFPQTSDEMLMRLRSEGMRALGRGGDDEGDGDGGMDESDGLDGGGPGDSQSSGVGDGGGGGSSSNNSSSSAGDEGLQAVMTYGPPAPPGSAGGQAKRGVNGAPDGGDGPWPVKRSGMSCPGMELSDLPFYTLEVNGRSILPGSSPAVFRVHPGLRYRLRAIAGSAAWALRLSVAAHRLSVIALDGQPVQPAAAEALILTPGERADLVLYADQPVDNYWINVCTLSGLCTPAVLSYEGAPEPHADPRVDPAAYAPRLTCANSSGSQPGLLNFKHATLAAAASVLPPPQERTRSFTMYVADAADTAPPPGFRSRAMRPDNPYGLPPSLAALLPGEGAPPGCPPYHNGSRPKFCYTINWVNYTQPAALPIYAARNASYSFAAEAAMSYGIEVRQGDVVDLVLINPSHMVHPMHLHGGAFWVLAAGNGRVTRDDDDRLNTSAVALNLRNPVLRDTVPVPQALPAQRPRRAGSPANGGGGIYAGSGSGNGADEEDDRVGNDGVRGVSEGGYGSGDGDGGMAAEPAEVARGAQQGGEAGPDPRDGYGYTVIRFVASNPGVWAFHCQIDLHAASGMMSYFVVRPPAGEVWPAPEGLDCRAAAGSQGSSGAGVGS